MSMLRPHNGANGAHDGDEQPRAGPLKKKAMIARKLMGNGRDKTDLTDLDDFVDADDGKLHPLKRMNAGLTPSASTADKDDDSTDDEDDDGKLHPLKRMNAGLTPSESADAKDDEDQTPKKGPLPSSKDVKKGKDDPIPNATSTKSEDKETGVFGLFGAQTERSGLTTA